MREVIFRNEKKAFNVITEQIYPSFGADTEGRIYIDFKDDTEINLLIERLTQLRESN